MRRYPGRSVRALRAAAGRDCAGQGTLEALEPRRLLATFTVTNLDDSGAGSLRQAINDANALAGADVVEFAENVTGEISLASGQLTITDDLSIDGPGARDLEINTSNVARVFRIEAGVTASMSGLTIADGQAPVPFFGGGGGGNIYNAGTLELNACAISGGYVRGSFYAYPGGGGGGIFNSGTLTLVNSTVSGNQASRARGSAIYNTGTLSVHNSTVSGNGGYDGGAAFGNQGGTITVTNSTVTNNENGSGLGFTGNYTVTSSIVAGNGNSGPATIVDGNLVGGDPGLRPLANNGGQTDTHALSAGNLAIGAGSNPLNLTTDQRGGLFARTGNGAIDIGAFQTQTPPSPLVVSTLSDVNDGDYTEGNLSLREAVELANGAAGADTITFNLPAGPAVIVLGGTDLWIGGDLTIQGTGADILSISGDNTSRVFQIATGVTVALDSLALVDGRAVHPIHAPNLENGGAILNAGTLTLSNVEVSGNTGHSGGGIYSTGTLTIIDSTISENTASSGAGGGVFTAGATTITDSQLSDNYANTQGGAISATGTLSITDSVIADNSTSNATTARGGGIFASAALTLTRSTVSGNTTGGSGTSTATNEGGGGIHARAFLTMTDCIVTGNSSRGIGGGMVAASATITDSTISENTATFDGGGIAGGFAGLLAGTFTISGSTIAHNSAYRNGGGVFIYGTLDMATSTVAGNNAREDGGGLYVSHTLTLANSTISGNRAKNNGGGIFASGTITSSTISGNWAAENGGGIFGSGTINNSTITDNEAQTLGGGVDTPGTIRLRSTIVAGNAGFDVSGTVAAGSTNNLVQDATVALGLINGVNGNILGVDPLLEPLADNGGPTLTHTLPAGSPALGTGSNPLNLTTDQRGDGFARVVEGRIDIGAFQLQTPGVGATTMALFGGAGLNIPLAHEAKTKRSDGTAFGAVQRFDDSKQITYRITNTGAELLVISLIEPRGQQPEDYTITVPPTMSIAPGGSSEFTVAFDPLAYGKRRASIAIFSNDLAHGGRFTLRIAGRGVPDPALPDIAVTGGTSPISDNDRKARSGTGQRFGEVDVGQSVVVVYTITNQGQSTLRFTTPSVRLAGANPGDFSVLAFPPVSSLAPNQSTTFSVRFTPSAAGPRRATIEVLSDDPDEATFDFRIIGTGI